MTHLDPDPRHVPEDEPRSSWERQRRPVLRPARPWGCVVALLVWLAFWVVVITLVIHIVTPREAADPTTSQPGAPGATGSVRASIPAPAGTSGRPLLGAPPEDSRVLLVSGRDWQAGKLGGAPSSPAVVSGPATWYRWHLNEAAAGPRLRAALGSHWRGSVVRVCAGRCVTVRLTDWCLCGDGRVVDLDARSFARLAPLSAGVLRVRVYLAGGLPQSPRPRPTPPPTDVGP